MATPVKSSAADRRGPNLWDVGVAGLVLLAACALLLFLHPEQGEGVTATATLDGAVIASWRLDRLTETEKLRVDGGKYPLVIEAAPGRIRVAESECPGEDCVRTGWAEKAGEQIVCLPNRLVISLTGAGGGEVDAVTG